MEPLKVLIKKEDLIDWGLAFCLVILAPFFLFPTLERIWIFLIIPIVLIGRGLVKKQIIERTILDWPIFLLSVQVLITCAVVPDIRFSLPKIAGALFGIVSFYAAVNLLKTEKLIKAGIILFLAGSLSFSILGLLGMFTFRIKYLDLLAHIKDMLPRVDFRLPGAEEGFHPNAVGGTLVLFIPIFIILTYSFIKLKNQKDLFLRSRVFKTGLFLGLLITLGILILTQSRGSWLALILSSSLPFFVLFGNNKIKRAFIFLFLPAVLIVSMVVYTLFVGKQKLPKSAAEIGSTIGGRTFVWSVGIETIKQHPFTGIGMNRIRFNSKIGYETAHVHNHLIHTGAELGIPALFSFLAILIGAGIMCFKVLKESNIPWMRLGILGLGWGQLAHFIFGFADSIPIGAKTGIFFWLSLALIAAIYNYVKRLEGA